MVKGKTRERRQARTREAIVQAAQEIIETQGAEALNMRAVGELTDYSASNIYEYFTGKDALVAAVCKETLGRLVAQVRQVSTGLDPAKRLLAYGKAYLEFARAHPQLYLLIFGRKLSYAELLGSAHSLTAYGLLKQIVEDGIEQAIFCVGTGAGADELTFGCLSLVHGIAMLRLTMQDVAWESQLSSDAYLLECFIRGMQQD